MRFVIDSFGSSQVCVGSDYPFNMGDTDPLGTLEKSGLDAAVLAAITLGQREALPRTVSFSRAA